MRFGNFSRSICHVDIKQLFPLCCVMVSNYRTDWFRSGEGRGSVAYYGMAWHQLKKGPFLAFSVWLVWKEIILKTTRIFRKRWSQDSHVISLLESSLNANPMWAVIVANQNGSFKEAQVIWLLRIVNGNIFKRPFSNFSPWRSVEGALTRYIDMSSYISVSLPFFPQYQAPVAVNCKRSSTNQTFHTSTVRRRPLWLKKSSLLPFAINCWVDNMR